MPWGAISRDCARTWWIFLSRTARTISSRLRASVRRRNSGDTNSLVGSRQSAAKTIFEISMPARPVMWSRMGIQGQWHPNSCVPREEWLPLPSSPVEEKGIFLLPVCQREAVPWHRMRISDKDSSRPRSWHIPVMYPFSSSTWSGNPTARR